MKLRLGRITFDTRQVARTEGMPEEAGLQESGLGAASVWTTLTRRGFVGGAWRALVAASLMPIAARSAFADNDEDDDDEDDDDEDEDDDDEDEDDDDEDEDDQDDGIVFDPPGGGAGGGF